jgi:hypothetical protein
MRVDGRRAKLPTGLPRPDFIGETLSSVAESARSFEEILGVQKHNRPKDLPLYSGMSLIINALIINLYLGLYSRVPINNFGRVAERRHCLPVYAYIRPRRSAKHHSFQLRFYSNSCFTNGELIHRPNTQPEGPVCFFSFFLGLVLHL